MVVPIADRIGQLRDVVAGRTPAPASDNLLVVGWMPYVSRQVEAQQGHVVSEFVRIVNDLTLGVPDTRGLFAGSVDRSPFELVLFGDRWACDMAMWAIESDVVYDLVVPFGDPPVDMSPHHPPVHHYAYDMVSHHARKLYQMSDHGSIESWAAARQFVHDHCDVFVVVANRNRRFQQSIQTTAAFGDTWLIHSDSHPTERVPNANQ